MSESTEQLNSGTAVATGGVCSIVAGEAVVEVSGKEATDSYSKVVYESDRESLNESFTVHDGIGFSFGKGRTTADSAVRIFSLREEIGDAPLEGIEGRYVYRFFKRAFDICFSALVLVCFCWLYAAIAIWIKVDDPKGPVIFKQERVGKNGKRFYMHKFRSMVVDAEDRLADLQHLNEKTGPVFKIKKDPRVTRAGYWLRKLSLASVIIGTPGDGESTKSLSRSANSSLDLQLCECRPGLCSTCNSHYKPFEFLSLGIFGGVPSLSRNLVGCNGFSPSEESAIRFSFLGFGKDGACAAW